MRVQIVSEEGLTRPYISKKAMLKIVAKKDAYISARDYQIKCLRTDADKLWVLAEEEKLMIRDMEIRLEKQIRLTYYVGVATSIIGSLVGFILNG